MRVKRFYRPELDALRFFAFLSVFLFHGMAFLLPGEVVHPERYHLAWMGMYGVPLFFFLSAYLITELLLLERDAFGQVNMGAFYVRRILRIWPLYFAVFFGFAFLNHFLPGVNPYARFSWPYFTFFLGNWYFAHHGFTGGPIDVLWTISVEEQFYILIAGVAAFGGRLGLRIASIAALVVSYGTIWWYAAHSAGVPAAGVAWSHEIGQWLNSAVQFQFFAGGALLAIILRGRVPAWGWTARAMALAGGLGCWAVAQTAFGLRGGMPFVSLGRSIAGTPFILGGCLLFMLAFLGIAAEKIPARLVHLGRISFGLYLLHALVYGLVGVAAGPWILRHFPIASVRYLTSAWAAVACALVTTIGLAEISYRFLESPFLRLKQRYEMVPSRPEEEASRPWPPLQTVN